MEGGEGMVAVVRGLKDAGLAVTLLDSGRQYTLLPDAVLHPDAPQVNLDHQEAYRYAGHQTSSQYGVHQNSPQYASHQAAAQYGSHQAAYQYEPDRDVSTRESGVQATDGRYASTYRMMHCHMTPTSPPELVTEFPPQKAELCPGRENFQIGGVGSGETYCLATKCDSFRGGMCWSDRGSVFSPKASTQPDSFTNSLRKYPNISQDRSSEIVERLICYTQAKHSAIKQRSNVSPTRNMDSDMSNQTINMDVPSRNITSPKYPRQLYEPDVRSKRLQESPTRERSRRGPVDQETLEAWRRSTFCRTNDVRCLRDVSRKVRDGIRTLSHQSNCQPEKLNSTRERCEPHMIDKGLEAQSNTNSVNMEIQDSSTPHAVSISR
ncbi:uncharacterized protein LOC123879152 isoform X4 [Maniola jurtina]|uniref:uncharacterized protein LOC123879152 isoform X4 n=1 Tax=Maniola jurtina TaxID=191418 RepID=UPI001E68BF36|nr:uncharacterized protein LOC123879152 isoform X4 [Maniola jurtina]